ncbi:unnamed protein product [Cladocopium goreaui]|uniref:NFX1-type zinc finger-containing protein 1 n=1 Tax=Cladocopium goreaui TaxID=2562237 RepID=A0A9P1GCH2_9DINO|nr:unnamed protein product [Cladocopium goreaui]
MVNHDHQRLNQIMLSLRQVQYECVAEQKCHNQMLQIMRNWRCPDQIEQWVAQDATLDQALIRACRRLVRQFLMKRANEKSPSGLTYNQLVKALDSRYTCMEDFCRHIVDPLGRDAETLALDALPQQLGIGLRMWILDRRDEVYRLSKQFHLDVSLFERLIHNGADHVTLLQQRRMHPKISRLIKPYYPQLRDHSSTERYPEIRGINARSYFMTHFHFEDDEGESHSHLNTFEANFVSALCAHLVSCGYEESQITVLSPYLGQVRLLKKRIQRDPTTQQIAVTAVDNFQGEENDIIVISLVRSNRARQMGFLAVENRINVALTRARHGIFIVGNAVFPSAALDVSQLQLCHIGKLSRPSIFVLLITC